jgi:hypothetical protein
MNWVERPAHDTMDSQSSDGKAAPVARSHNDMVNYRVIVDCVNKNTKKI